jgi:hypothetical protein
VVHDVGTQLLIRRSRGHWTRFIFTGTVWPMSADRFNRYNALRRAAAVILQHCNIGS